MHKQPPLSLQQQIDDLRLIGESPMVRMLLPISLATGLTALLLLWKSSHETMNVLYLFVAGCSGLVALATGLAAGHARTAAIATRKGRRERAMLHLLAPDHDADQSSYRGKLQLRSSGSPVWNMEFAPARGWHPPLDPFEVEAVFLSDIAWPVLVISPGRGLLWPRSKPRREPR